ncbi:hypothetical protein SYN65AY6LI_08150 [Synechococcus sp. 65AY6Li]|jgi:hypothetical protein|uniref:hypothetical protein n=1 Tax=unclassified Synechococcus TaxID=2626047 RepID=UPI00006946AC|nr:MULTISPECIES: hypothetical protein [unclassified Synechococcus]ABD00294.1 hypothetical protein CYA_2153 [Synechococcus sp. JA-3-3Ab]PIK92197.1 hypothetical protein SYN65AY6LI_08150 [Synechococcus sp. 65AY6Li]
MPLLSPLRLRRLARQEQLRNRQTLITFQLGSYCFGLPVDRARRVFSWAEFQLAQEGGPQLLDTGRLLLGRGIPFQPEGVILLQPGSSEDGLSDQIDNPETGALPIPTQPLLRRLTSSQLQPLPSRYAAQARQRGIVQWIPPVEGQLPLLVFDPHLWPACS